MAEKILNFHTVFGSIKLTDSNFCLRIIFDEDFVSVVTSRNMIFYDFVKLLLIMKK